MLRTTLLSLVAILLVHTQPVDAFIVVDVDGNGAIDVGDIDRWNQINRWDLCGLFPHALCRPFLDVNLDDVVCFGDRDRIVGELPVVGGVFGTIYGDANRDGVVDADDMNQVGANWQQPGNWADGDFNGDGIVDSEDLNIIGLNWQRTRIEFDYGRCTCDHCINGDNGDDQ